jgi:L-gulonolactone oxidase
MAFHAGVTVKTASDAFHFQNTYAKCWDLSYSMPAGDAAEGWGRAIELVEHYAKSRLYPVNLAVHGRFTAASDAWIAPDHGRATAYVEITTAVGTPHWEGFFRELEDRWCEIDGSRPHWAKMYWRNHRIASRYPKFDAFLEVRERWDPRRVFLNDFLEKQIFQLPSKH